jgi:hypothetical protein
VLKSLRVALAAALFAVALGVSPASAQTTPPNPNCAAGHAPAPAVVTEQATGVSDTNATLRGTVNPNGCPTTYHFEYGTTTAYGTTTPATPAGSGTSAIAAVHQAIGLLPDTTYHFKLVAVSAAGTVSGADMSFHTPKGCVPKISLPLAATQPASSVSSTTAILNGVVGPNSCETKYHFEYGTSTAYGSSTPTRSVGAGSNHTSVSALITGLAQGTTYHYRIVAISSAGTSDGTDATFTTGRTPKKPVSKIRIDSRRPSVLPGFVVAMHLHCTAGASACNGSVALFRNNKFFGRHLFSIAAGTTRTVFVKLNGRGRRLMRHHKQLRHVEVVARSANRAVRFVVLVRTFRP